MGCTSNTNSSLPEFELSVYVTSVRMTLIEANFRKCTCSLAKKLQNFFCTCSFYERKNVSKKEKKFQPLPPRNLGSMFVGEQHCLGEGGLWF
jgi:hypothetical protein